MVQAQTMGPGAQRSTNETQMTVQIWTRESVGRGAEYVSNSQPWKFDISETG